MWLGPAAWRPFHDSLINGGFRPFRDYSGGGMTDWGAHRFGAAMFAVGVHKTGPVEVIPPDGKDHKLLTYRFANGMRMWPQRSCKSWPAVTPSRAAWRLASSPASPARGSSNWPMA